MGYQIIYEKRAIKSLAKLDKCQQKMIISWIENNLESTKNPRQYGKAFKGSLKKYWQYRVGRYRILADIDEEEIKIIIFNIGHRKDVYEK